MSDKISDERKMAYYGGHAISIFGLLLFASNFLVGISMPRALGGMALMVIGKIVAQVGARGLAGSGVVLDPKQAREDLKPYSKMSGGMFKDGLDESGIPEMMSGSRAQTIMIRCRDCQELNEEDSKFCQECGQPI